MSSNEPVHKSYAIIHALSADGDDIFKHILSFLSTPALLSITPKISKYFRYASRLTLEQRLKTEAWDIGVEKVLPILNFGQSVSLRALFFNIRAYTIWKVQHDTILRQKRRVLGLAASSQLQVSPAFAAATAAVAIAKRLHTEAEAALIAKQEAILIAKREAIQKNAAASLSPPKSKPAAASGNNKIIPSKPKPAANRNNPSPSVLARGRASPQKQQPSSIPANGRSQIQISGKSPSPSKRVPSVTASRSISPSPAAKAAPTPQPSSASAAIAASKSKSTAIPTRNVSPAPGSNKPVLSSHSSKPISTTPSRQSTTPKPAAAAWPKDKAPGFLSPTATSKSKLSETKPAPKPTKPAFGAGQGERGRAKAKADAAAVRSFSLEAKLPPKPSIPLSPPRAPGAVLDSKPKPFGNATMNAVLAAASPPPKRRSESVPPGRPAAAATAKKPSVPAAPQRSSTSLLAIIPKKTTVAMQDAYATAKTNVKPPLPKEAKATGKKPEEKQQVFDPVHFPLREQDRTLLQEEWIVGDVEKYGVVNVRRRANCSWFSLRVVVTPSVNNMKQKQLLARSVLFQCGDSITRKDRAVEFAAMATNQGLVWTMSVREILPPILPGLGGAAPSLPASKGKQPAASSSTSKLVHTLTIHSRQGLKLDRVPAVEWQELLKLPKDEGAKLTAAGTAASALLSSANLSASKDSQQSSSRIAFSSIDRFIRYVRKSAAGSAASSVTPSPALPVGPLIPNNNDDASSFFMTASEPDRKPSAAEASSPVGSPQRSLSPSSSPRNNSSVPDPFAGHPLLSEPELRFAYLALKEMIPFNGLDLGFTVQ